MTTNTTTIIANKRHKKAKVAAGEEEEEEENKQPESQAQPLLSGLPDHLSQLSLSRLPPTLLHSVCRAWRRLIYSPSFPPFLSLYALISSDNTTNSIQFSSFNPISASWQPLPPPPPDPLLRPLLLRHPSFIARELPVQSVAVSGRLALVAATTHHLLPALPRPLLFDPLRSQWSHGPPFSAPRRWCAAGAVSGSLYVASGVSSHYNQDVARSAHRWRPVPTKKINRGRTERWEKVAGLRDGKFSREEVEGVGWRGKLCMVNVKGNAAKQGVVYDTARDEWEEMKEGMLKGWNGPAAAMNEEEMYVVDEGRGALERYREKTDCWEVVAESEMLRGAVQMAAGGGKVCVVCGGGDGIVVVDVVARPVRFWVVARPPDSHVLAVHVLPRMSMPEDDW